MKYILCFFLLVIVCSCSSNNYKVENQGNETVINIDLNSKRKDAADFFDYHHSVVLETTNECLINDIGRIEFYKDNIYILDSKLDCIFIYDMDGSFKYEINKKGDSPEEYSSITDFYIDKEEECIYIYDGFLGSVLVVDLQGDFRQRITLPKGYSFIKLKNGNWLFYLGNGVATLDNKTFNNLLWCDEDFIQLKQGFPINKELLGRRYSTGGVKSVFSVYNNQMFFLPFLSNKIYLYDSELNDLIPEYEIRYTTPQYNINLNEYTKAFAVERYLEDMNRGEVPSRINNFYATYNAAMFNFSFEGKPLMCFYDRVNDETKICEFGIHECGLIFGPPSVYFTDQTDALVLNIMDESLLEYCRSDNSKKVIEDINHRIGEVKDPNPILVFYSFKNN